VKQGKILETELAERWRSFRTTLNQLVEGAGPEFTEYEEKHRHLLTETAIRLAAEHKSTIFP